MRVAASLAFAALVMVAVPTLAQEVGTQIDEARALYQKGEAAKAANLLQDAAAALYARLGQSLASMLPPPPAGWEAGEPDAQSLSIIGGGLTVTRGYQKGDSLLNASLILDNPAVTSAATMFANPQALASQPGMKLVKLGGDDAVLRWDGAARSGEIMMLLGNRVLLQVEGSELPKADLLTDMMKGFNVVGIRKQAGL